MESPFTFLSTGPRHAEQADTRLGIRRDGREGSRRRESGEKHSQDKPDPREDVTAVSLQDLLDFLNELAIIPVPRSEKANENLPLLDGLPQSPSVTPVMARANTAYRTASRTGHTPLFDPPAENALPPEDRQTILEVLDDLHVLRDRGTTMITIRRAGTFLDSIRRAVAEALSV